LISGYDGIMSMKHLRYEKMNFPEFWMIIAKETIGLQSSGITEAISLPAKGKAEGALLKTPSAFK
jgi:hypothetical protein